MTELHIPSLGLEAAEPVITQKKGKSAFSPIWIVPVVAAIVALWLTYRHYDTLGPLITITFDSAEGIEAGRTPIKRLDVEIGRVEKIELDGALDQVIVTARMVQSAEDYLNSETRFWIVRPHIGLSGVTGLQTLLSGNYIEMSGTPDGEMETHFEGLKRPPLTPSDAPGLRIILRAEEAGSVAIGSPVFYRRINVGTVETRKLSADGGYVEFEAFIDAPYHRLVNSNTRFWNASGIEVRIDTEGFVLHSESLETIISGGIAFSNPPQLHLCHSVESGARFTLHKTRTEAEIQPAEGVVERLGFVLHFDQSVRGLNVGAPVELRGVQVGYVADIDIRYNEDTGLFETPALIFIEPQRIKWPIDASIEEGLPSAVEKGMRARLKTGSMLTGALFVELALISDAEPAWIVPQEPYPLFPTAPSASFSQVASKAASLFDALRALPLNELVSSASQLFRDFDTLLRIPEADEFGVGPDSDRIMAQLREAPLRRFMDSMTTTLGSIDTIIGAQETQDLPADLSASLVELRETLKSVRGLLQGDATASPFYYEFSVAMQELTRAAQAVRSLTETLETKPNALIFGK